MIIGQVGQTARYQGQAGTIIAIDPTRERYLVSIAGLQIWADPWELTSANAAEAPAATPAPAAREEAGLGAPVARETAEFAYERPEEPAVAEPAVAEPAVAEAPRGKAKPLKWHRQREGFYLAKGHAPDAWFLAMREGSTKWALMLIHGDPAKNEGTLLGRYPSYDGAKHAADKANRKPRREPEEAPNLPPMYPEAALTKKEEKVLGDACVPIVTLKRDGARYEQCLKAAQALGPIDSPAAIYRLLHKPLMEEDQEVFLVLGSDIRGQLRGVVEVARGQRSGVAVGYVDIMRAVMAMGCERFFVIHQHPSGNAKPSKDDRTLTDGIKKAAAPFADEVVFADHIVIGSGEFFSFHDGKLHKAK